MTGSQGVDRILGYRLRLRLVTPDDAEYIYGLRTDPQYNAHLSDVAGTVIDQREWIESYKTREAEGREFYYIIERLADCLACGVVRLYDIGNSRFTWGSWILDQNKPPKAALESAILSFGTAFRQLGLTVADIDVRKRNTRAIAFYRRIGMRETRSDKESIYFEFTREQFEENRELHRAVLHGLGSE